MSFRKNQHLLNRVGFGPAATQWADLERRTPAALWTQLKRDSAAVPAYIDVLDAELLQHYTVSGITKTYDEARRVRVQARHHVAIRDLNLRWMREMAESSAQLREKMAFFWHGHFCTYTLNIHHAQQLLHVLRTHAIGNFGTLLRETARSAAMMLYLNAQQNRKGQPNENFARELMELFTLGRGNYTEVDIKEAARAITGWRVENDGRFSFNEKLHDEGNKTVFGKTGPWKGDDIIDLVLQRRETAVHITRKIYRFLVNDTPDEKRVAALATVFQKSNYEIGALLDAIVGADWFYAPAEAGARIKSPVELLVGLRRTLGLRLDNEDHYLLLQRVLGQTLFFPPNVAGWPGGRTWIDSTTLMIRMRLPKMPSEQDTLNVQGKPDYDMRPGTGATKPGNVVSTVFSNAKVRTLDQKTRIEARFDWQPHLKRFASVPREQLPNAIGDTLLATPLQVPADLLAGYADNESRERFIRSAILQVMCLPEYQLC